MDEPSWWILPGPFRRRVGPASAGWAIRSVRGTELAPPRGAASRRGIENTGDQAIRVHPMGVLMFLLVRAAAKRPGPVAQWKSV
ncbi:hypothetical protein, partial [Rhodococcus sp. P14]|uniref:hypothetical protein n=1 Tax=Rhodococcus sp. P14 TaxID=450821 RepID=UPI001ED96635